MAFHVEEAIPFVVELLNFRRFRLDLGYDRDGALFYRLDADYGLI